MRKSLFQTLEHWVLLLNKGSHVLSLILLFGLAVLTFMDVTGRYFFEPVEGTFEMTELGLALIIFLSLGYTQRKKDHVSIGFLVEKFPQRVRHFLDMITYSVLIVVLFALSWQMIGYGNRISSQITSELGLPVSLFIILAAIGVILYALTLLIELCAAVKRVGVSK